MSLQTMENLGTHEKIQVRAQIARAERLQLTVKVSLSNGSSFVGELSRGWVDYNFNVSPGQVPSEKPPTYQAQRLCITTTINGKVKKKPLKRREIISCIESE